LVELDDLLSAGREGLLDAARRYDPDRGIPFRAYANFRVRGAIFDGVRHMAGLPRRAYERIAALNASLSSSEGGADQAFPGLTKPGGDGAAEAILSEQLATTATAYAMGLLLTSAGASDLNEASEHGSPEEAYARAELRAYIEQELRGLEPAREAEIIRLHYFDGLSIEAISQELGIDRSWVSRLHTRGMARLNKRLRHLG
jgi:RNA polymerase sigma factor for flagellar operon FliA